MMTDSIGRQLFPFAVTFRPRPRSPETQTWTRFYPSLDHANADVADVVQREYPRAPIGLITVSPFLGFFPQAAA